GGRLRRGRPQTLTATNPETPAESSEEGWPAWGPLSTRAPRRVLWGSADQGLPGDRTGRTVHDQSVRTLVGTHRGIHHRTEVAVDDHPCAALVHHCLERAHVGAVGDPLLEFVNQVRPGFRPHLSVVGQPLIALE